MAVLQFSRKRKTTPDRCLTPEKSQHVDVPRQPAPDAVAVAAEHVSFLRRSGVGIIQAMAAINQSADGVEGWDAVRWAYAEAFERVRQS